MPPKRRRHWPWVLGALVAIAVLFVFFIASVELLHYTESTEFCSLCHVMKPEYTAYEHSPHARAECGSCHIGPGALPAFQAKVASARYLWVYPTNQYERQSQTTCSIVCTGNPLNSVRKVGQVYFARILGEIIYPKADPLYRTSSTQPNPYAIRGWLNQERIVDLNVKVAS